VTDRSVAGFAVYIHWPFCLSKCPYCDFNSHVSQSIDHARWRAALLAELDHFAADTPAQTVTSIFFGGGTPSLMEPETAAALIGRVRARWPVAEDLEITLEANPTSAEAGRFRAFRDAGVNRLSLGVQSLEDEALRFLGRHHSAAEARAALTAARDIFSRTSFDLIYARPGQSAAAWRRELAEALDLAAGHLSLYQLTIEPGTAFHREGVSPADNDSGYVMFRETRDLLSQAGLPAYEVSNHARPLEECRHNLTYWQGGDYIGVGPGAHGRITINGITQSVTQTPSPERWLTSVEKSGNGTITRTSLSAKERFEERVLMGMRLTDGLDRILFRYQNGRALEDSFDPETLCRLKQEGYVTLDQRGLRATEAGMVRLDGVIAALLDA